MRPDFLSGLNRRSVIKGGAAFGLGVLTATRSHSAPKVQGKPVRAAVLIDDGATLIDFAGLWQALGDADVAKVPGFEIYSVAPQKRVYKTYGELLVAANYSFDDAPDPDLVFMGAQEGAVPGTASRSKLDYIKRAYDRGKLIASACTGSLIIAQTGLLDGREATTHHDFFHTLATNFPKVSVVRDRRIVPQGRIVTAGGEACSLDLGLWLVEHYYGAQAARETANYMEYIPNPGAIA